MKNNPENFLNSGSITKIKPSIKLISDIKKGKMILDCISKFDIGQSLIIQSEILSELKQHKNRQTNKRFIQLYK